MLSISKFLLICKEVSDVYWQVIKLLIKIEAVCSNVLTHDRFGSASCLPVNCMRQAMTVHLSVHLEYLEKLIGEAFDLRGMDKLMFHARSGTDILSQKICLSFRR